MIFIVTGPVNSGKTTFLRGVAAELKNQGFRIDGFLSEAVEKNFTGKSYDLFDLRNEISIPFIRRKGRDSWEKIGPYFFIPDGLKKAKEIILRSKDMDILIVDEIGPLELSGGGIWPELKRVVWQRNQKYFFTARASILKEIQKLFKKIQMKTFDIREKALFPRFLKEVCGPANE